MDADIKQLVKYENRWRKVLAVQQVHLKYKEEGITLKHIYFKYIKDAFFIGYRTYTHYLTLNAKRSIKLIEEYKKQAASCEQ